MEDMLEIISKEQLQAKIAEKNVESIREIFEEYNIVDLCEVVDELPDQDILFLFKILKKDVSAEMFTYLSQDVQEQLITSLTGPDIKIMLENVYSDDILEFIRCKAAAHTMVATLLGESGITLNDVSSIYLAGGFGTHIDIESAITVGIYPDVERSKLKILGNSSLIGAKRLLVDESLMLRVKDLLNRAVYVQFAEMDKFVENMVAAQFIPHTDHNLYPSVKPRR